MCHIHTLHHITFTHTQHTHATHTHTHITHNTHTHTTDVSDELYHNESTDKAKTKKMVININVTRYDV